MFGSGSSKELPNLASFAFIKSGLFVLRICILCDFYFFPLHCRRSYAADLQGLLRLIFNISLFCNYGKLEGFHSAFVTSQIPDGHLDKPHPFGVRKAWTNPQKLRILLNAFPKYTTLLRYRNELPLSFPSCGFTAPVGSPAICKSIYRCARLCSCVCAAPGWLWAAFWVAAMADTSSSCGCAGQDLLQQDLFKAFRALTHARLRQVSGSPADLPGTEGHSLLRDRVDFLSPDVSRPRLEALLGGMV